MHRRHFIRRMFAGGTVIYFGCGEEDGISAMSDAALPDADAPDAAPADATPDMAGPDLGDGDPDLGIDAAAPDMGAEACPDPFVDGAMMEVVPFTGGDPLRFHQRVNQGWDGRLYTDLSLLDRDRPVTPNAEFYIRTHFPDLLDLEAATPWRIEVTGMVSEPGSLLLADLLPLVEDMGTHVLECSGNGRRGHYGLMSAASWRGIPIEAVLDLLDPLPGATHVEINGFDEHSVPSANNHSTPGAAWIFTPEQLIERGAFFATEMNGEILPLDHGFPVRLYMPGWYGCVSIKWVDRIRLVGPDEPSTSQMREFASRTHQRGVPELARDFAPAEMHQAAMPIRVERWDVGGRAVFRVVGILWGGSQPTDGLTIRFGPGEPFVPVHVCPPMTGNDTWTIWEHRWTPRGPGDYVIRCAIDDPAVPTQRLDTGYYDRFITI